MNYSSISAAASLACVSLLMSSSAIAAETWGTWAGAFSLNCSSADCSGGGVSGGDSMFPPNVVNFQATPATNSVSGPLGDAAVTAGFEPASPGLATMKQTGEAHGGSTGVASARGKTLDFVTYSGPTTTISIDVDLTGNHTGPDSGADNSLDGIRGNVYVFTDDNAIAQIDGAMSPDLNCLFECYVPDEQALVAINDSSLTDSDSIVLTLDDGDGFYIYGEFNIAGAGGGSTTSLDSFTYQFSSVTGLTSLAGGGGGPVDSDGDGVPDSADNCTLIANASQLDADGDGYGNACDGDLNDDLIVNIGDLGIMRAVFFSADAVADLNGDGTVNTADLGILRAGFFQPPGPSGIAP